MTRCNFKLVATQTLRFACAVLFAGAFALALPTESQARTKVANEFSVAGWDAGQLRDEQTGAFESCYAYGSYKSGISLYVFVTKDWNWFISLFHKDWNFRDQKLTASYRYDGGAWLKVDADAQQDMVRLYMPSEKTSAELFAASHYLEVSVLGQKFAFDLGGTRRMFDALVNCVSAEVKPQKGSSAESSQSSSSEPAAPAPTPPAPAEKEKSGIAYGTGFYVSQYDVLTNQHVIEGCSDVTVLDHRGEKISASVTRTDKLNDLAVLRTERSTDARPATLRQSGMRVGDQVAVFGFPLAGMLSTSGSLTSGNISSMAGLGDDVRLFQISAPIQPGNSGGPLLDMSANVIGITNMKLSDLATAEETGSLPQNVNFAIKSSVAVNFLDAHSVRYDATPNTQPLSLPDVVDRAKEFTVQVMCK